MSQMCIPNNAWKFEIRQRVMYKSGTDSYDGKLKFVNVVLKYHGGSIDVKPSEE